MGGGEEGVWSDGRMSSEGVVEFVGSISGSPVKLWWLGQIDGGCCGGEWEGM